MKDMNNHFIAPIQNNGLIQISQWNGQIKRGDCQLCYYPFSN